jgi:hypothetical protein
MGPGLFPRESELRHRGVGTNGPALGEASGRPTLSPRARPVIEGAVANGCALVICAALPEPPHAERLLRGIFPGERGVATTARKQVGPVY